MAYPILAGGAESYFYEVVWRYVNSSWQRMGDRIGKYHHAVQNPCGAFNPLGINPNFYYAPPWQVYQVFWYTGNTWVMCYQERNW